MAALFEAAPLTVVSPSEVTLGIWQARSGLEAAATRIVPHCAIEPGKSADAPLADDAPVRVAFAGIPADHKGWPVFRELARRERKAEGLAFAAFSSEPPGDPLVEHVPVRVTPEAPDAMIESLHEHGAKLAVMWASGPETFSLAAHEALAAGAAILCPARAGNIARLVERTGAGCVFDTEAELFDFFASGEAERFARGRRQARSAPASLAFGGFTAALMEEGDA